MIREREIDMTSVGAAFRLISRKPVVLALALPAKAAGLLLLKVLAPGMGDAVVGMAGDGFAALALGCGAGVAALSLLELLVLQPAALQALREAALGEEAKGWFGRGVRRHWHKPLAVSAFQGVLQFCLWLTIGFFLVALGAMQALAGGLMVAASAGSVAVYAVLATVFVLAALLLAAYCRLMLVQMTEMSFPDALRAAASRWAWVWRMTAAQAVSALAVMAVVAAFGAAHGWLTGALPPLLGPQSADDRLLSALTVVLGFIGSWTGFFTLLAAALARVFLLAYAFVLATHGREAGGD